MEKQHNTEEKKVQTQEESQLFQEKEGGNKEGQQHEKHEKQEQHQRQEEQDEQKMANLMKQAKEDFHTRLTEYLEGGNPVLRMNGKTKEFEIRFGTNTRPGGSRPVSKLDYDNVVKQIRAVGFKPDQKNGDKGIEMLRINTEYMDKNGQVKQSNIRAELLGIDMIQDYCKTNSLEKVATPTANIENKIKFTQKSSTIGKDGKYQKPIDLPDMNFRVSYQLEQDYQLKSPVVSGIVSKWADNKKNFRCMNRVRFEHPELPINIDLSIVRTNAKVNGVQFMTYTIQQAKVFENVPTYEIELEVDNARVGNGTKYQTVESIMEAIRKATRIILGGIQGSNYPISFTERNSVYRTYMRMMHGIDFQPRNIRSGDFIGPDSYTLQIENILEASDDSSVPNIRDHYSVTDKADGDRKMLFVSHDGKIYFIDKNMNITFTGCKTGEKTIFLSLIDGEHIKYDKNRNFINLYAAFDIYFVNGKSIREREFMFDLDVDISIDEETEDKKKKEHSRKTEYRLPLLNRFTSILKPSSIINENNVVWKEIIGKKGEKGWMDQKSGKIVKVEPKKNVACGIRVECKKFYFTTASTTIFEGCSNILSNVADGVFDYETDGLIFTPSNTGVASNRGGVAGPLRKTTWDMSFKWKPIESNTIDFLVSVKKDNTGKDKISNIFQDGLNTQGATDVVQYKTLILMCGFNEKEHGYENPFNDIIHERLPHADSKHLENEDLYQPVPFNPTDPYDEKGSICNIFLKNDGQKQLMLAEDGDHFQESTIVEFRYDKSKEPGWRWIPIRVRYDKTQKLLAKQPEYGNAYHVANNNWHSIHNEITEDMIRTGEGVPDRSNLGEGDVYYNECYNEESKTVALRNFHNLYIKKKLVLAVSEPGQSLIDYAVGRGGDIPKWKAARLGFVLGIDLFSKNIMDPVKGACARYLNECKKTNRLFYAIFVNGNTALNIRDDDAVTDQKEKQIVNAIFGQGIKDERVLGKGVFKRYGIAETGFNISSCQFALHYFFENPKVLHGFMRNLAECTKINGYFIGTCFDGSSIFDLLKKKQKGETHTFMTSTYNGKSKKICEIAKKYDETGFAEDETSIGYAIDVYQESINKVCREYLVNFKYLVRILENYGFTPLTKDEAIQMGLPNSSGLFSELFATLEKEVQEDARKKSDYKQATNMTTTEKNISFLNRYFVFKKTTTVSAEKIAKLLMNAKKISSAFESDDEEEEDAKELKAALEKEDRLKSPVRGQIKKLKARVDLKAMSNGIPSSGIQLKDDYDEEDEEKDDELEEAEKEDEEYEKETKQDKEDEKETKEDKEEKEDEEYEKEEEEETKQDKEEEKEMPIEKPIILKK